MLFPDSNLVSSSANLFLANSNVLGVEYSAFGSGLRNYSKQGGDNRRNSLALYTSDIGQQNTNRIYINYNGDIGINDDTPIYKLDVNGTFGVSGAATLSSTLAVQGDITENGYNVLTNLDTASLSSRINVKLSATDTASLSNRINLKYDKTGGTISGAVTLSTTTATPTSLLGKDGSNVVGTVTTVAQTGLFGRGSVTNAVTDANGNITVAHGFNFTPIMAFANLPAQTANTVNVKSVDATNIVFVVRDGATFSPLNVQTVTKIEFFAIK
jgi:CRISPR-associated DxTHG motif protein